MIRKRLLVVMLLLRASGVQAEVYTWSDARGIAHYTNKYYEIPERYKAKAKPLHLEAVEPGSAAASQQGTPSRTQTTPPTPQAAPSPPSQPPVVNKPVAPAPVGATGLPGNRRMRHSGNE